MAFEDDFAVCVDQNYMRNASDTVILTCRANTVLDIVVLYFEPFFVLDAIFECVHVLIYRKTNNADFVSPICCSCFKHVLVVRHRLLAGSAPCCPEIVQNYLSLFMFYGRLAFFCNLRCVYNVCHLITNNNRARYFDFEIRYLR